MNPCACGHSMGEHTYTGWCRHLGCLSETCRGSSCEATRLQAVAWERTLQDRLWEAECAVDDLVCEVLRLRKELHSVSPKMRSGEPEL